MAFDWGALTGQVIGAGKDVYGSTQEAKAARDAAAAQVKNNETALQLAQINQDTVKLQLSGAQAVPSSNTTLYIVLGVGGVLVLGLTIFAVTRK